MGYPYRTVGIKLLASSIGILVVVCLATVLIELTPLPDWIRRSIEFAITVLAIALLQWTRLRLEANLPESER